MLMILLIEHSVGIKGLNQKPDVVVVQSLLNRHIATGRHLRVDGLCGHLTQAAIIAFQRRAGFHHPDGLVEPNGPTWRLLISEMILAGIAFDLETILHEAQTWFSTHTNHLTLTPQNTLHFTDWDTTPPAFDPNPKALCWGAKVSAEFKAKVIEISKELEINPDYLMACMAFETGASFSPSQPNKKGSGATGLIQFMPQTAEHTLHTSTAKLAKMTAVEQLDYVRQYLQPYKGKMNTLEDVYMAIIYPKLIGKPPSTVVFVGGTKYYTENDGFDHEKKGTITIQDISSSVRQKYEQGFQNGNFG